MERRFMVVFHIFVIQRCSQTPSHVVGFPRFGFGTHGSYRDTVVIYNININCCSLYRCVLCLFNHITGLSL